MRLSLDTCNRYAAAARDRSETVAALAPPASDTAQRLGELNAEMSGR